MFGTGFPIGLFSTSTVVYPTGCYSPVVSWLIPIKSISYSPQKHEFLGLETNLARELRHQSGNYVIFGWRTIEGAIFKVQSAPYKAPYFAGIFPYKKIGTMIYPYNSRTTYIIMGYIGLW